MTPLQWKTSGARCHEWRNTKIISLIAALQQNMASRKWQLKFKKKNDCITDNLLAPGEPDHKYLKLTKKVTKGSALNIAKCDAGTSLQ
jgi:hypothetical protein